MPISVPTSPIGQPHDPTLRKKRIVQIELKVSLKPLGARAKSPSAFRFTTPDGGHIAGLHEIVQEHEMHSAYPAIQLRYPGKLRRRKRGEKARLSRFCAFALSRACGCGGDRAHAALIARSDACDRVLRILGAIRSWSWARGACVSRGSTPGDNGSGHRS